MIKEIIEIRKLTEIQRSRERILRYRKRIRLGQREERAILFRE